MIHEPEFLHQSTQLWPERPITNYDPSPLKIRTSQGHTSKRGCEYMEPFVLLQPSNTQNNRAPSYTATLSDGMVIVALKGINTFQIYSVRENTDSALVDI
jgi:hypothetical protein